MNDPDTHLLPLMLIRAAGLPLYALDLHKLDANAIENAQNALLDGQAAQSQQVASLFLHTLQTLPESTLRTEVYNTRRKWHKQATGGSWNPIHIPPHWRQEPACQALCETLQTWNDAAATASQTRANHQLLYQTQLAAEYSGLQQLAQHPTLLKALLFSSHDLLAALPAFHLKNPAQFAKKDRQLARSLWQYATRAAFKTSPLSHFTTVTLKRLAELPPETNPDSPSFQTHRSIVTPNVALLPALYNLLLEAPVFYRALSVSLNPCIVGPTSPAYEWLFYNGELESFQRTAATTTLDFIVEALLENQRELPFPELCAQLQEASGSTPEKTERYLLDLVDIGLLEWQLPEKGLSPSWCGKLYQWLGFLPNATPLISETANLLLWLRTAARSLPFQSIESARDTQLEAQRQIQRFFERFGAAAPPIPCEQLFFEDVEANLEIPLPVPVLEDLAAQLASCWRNGPPRPLTASQATVFRALEAALASPDPANGPDQSKKGVNFLIFSKKILETTAKNISPDATAAIYQKNRPGKIGALLQIYREGEQWRAVVNALFPGGGKLMARWAHLFPPGAIEQLQTWFDPDAIPYPWQDWHNASFQPAVAARSLAVPGGRTISKMERPILLDNVHVPETQNPKPKTQNLKERPILLGNVQVVPKPNGEIGLFDPDSGKSFLLTDLGLEAPSERPPAMRLLWQVGVPPVSKELLWTNPEPSAGGPGWLHWSRIESGSLVLARARWQTAPGFFDRPAAALPNTPGEKDFEHFLHLRKQLASIGVPRLFFARVATPVGQKPDKPQYFDADSPFAMLEFQKWAANNQHNLLLTEMLPLPSQCFVQKDGASVASECVIELEV